MEMNMPQPNQGGMAAPKVSTPVQGTRAPKGASKGDVATPVHTKGVGGK